MVNIIVNPVRKFVGNFRPLSNRFRCYFALTTIQRGLLSNGVKTFGPAYKGGGSPLRLLHLLCLSVTYLFFTAGMAGAATYYLDAVNGNDSNPGTKEEPWKTINRAAPREADDPNVDSGDTVIVRGGYYGLVSSLDKANWRGASTDWITYRAEDPVNDRPKIRNIKLSASTIKSVYLSFKGFDFPWTYDGNDIGASRDDGKCISIDDCSYFAVHDCNFEGNPNWMAYTAGSGMNCGAGSTAGFISHIEVNDCTFTNFSNAIQGTRVGDKDVEESGYYIHDCNISYSAIDHIQIRSPIHSRIMNNNLLYGNWCRGRTGGSFARRLPDANGTASGTFAAGDTLTQGERTGTLTVHQIIGEGGEFHFQTDFSGGWTTDEVTSSSGGTFTPSGAVLEGHHGDVMQLYGSSLDEYNTDGGLVGLVISGNYIHEGMQLIFLKDVNGVLIENNLITGWVGTVHVCTLSSRSVSGVIRNNTFLTGNTTIRIYGNSTYGDHFDVYNNITRGYIQLASEWGNTANIKNNICGYLNTAGGTVTRADNYVNNDYISSSTFDSWFVDYDGGDYRLKNSIVKPVDFGTTENYSVTDILGNPRDASPDAGCYEFSPIDPNNPPPVLQAIGDKSVDENVALIFDVNAIDPNGEPITYSAQGLPSGAMLDPLTGDFAWTPSYNQAGIYQVRFIASDGNSWDSETITTTVNNVNRPPVLGSITDQSVNENALLSIPVEASDPDGQALTYSVSGLPAGAVFVSQTLTWTPSYDQAGTFGVTFTADDGQAQDSEAITITVINVNRTPVLTAINNQSVWADDPLTFTIDATDPDGDAVTYSAGTLPTGATFIGRDFDWTPSQGQMGSYDVTFIASDGQLQDSQMVTITVDVDSLAPTITNSLPAAGSIQAPLNNLINLNITDAGKGVDAGSVTIKVNNNTVYTGDTNHYSSPDGECRRLGNKTDYRFVYQSNEEFDYDQIMGITVTATDLASNVMSEHSYSFVTEIRSFGQNKQVNSGSVNLNSDRPVTVRDSSGNIWAAWHAGPIDNRDIYIGKLAAGADDFGSTVQLTTDAADQCNPAVALDSSDKLYVVWQDNREGDWDIYVSTSVDGISWSTETRVNDPNNDNQVNPAIVIDDQSPNQAHVAWQDDRAGNQDICIATSSDGFVTKTVSQITSDISDQIEPAVTADSANTIYVVWMDGRNGPNDIYGAASNNGPWTNVAIVNNANDQSSPAIAAEGAGSILHLLWADDTSGDNDIYYATSNGLLDCPLTGFSIIDDTTGADQLEPAIVVEGSTGNDLKVFACWQDWRNADTDLYFAELSAGSGTNVFVGDGGSSAYQGEPVIGIDEYSHPYLVWADSRNTDIYYAGSTFVEPVPLISELAPFSKGAVYGLPVGQLSNPGDICMQIPGGAYSHEMKLKASRIKNARRFTSRQSKIPYEFSPSGIEFNVPITITIAYEPVGSAVSVYWHDPMTGTLKQDGITNVTIIEKSTDLHLVRFKVRHFTAFYLIGGGAAAALGGGGGGGCSVSAGGEGNIVEFALPYIGLVVVMAILKVRDSRRRKAHIA